MKFSNSIWVICVATLLLTGCSVGDTNEPSSSNSTQSTPTESTSSISSECLPVSESLLAAINQGVLGVDPSNSLTRAYAVVAPERENVWFVAAAIAGPGIKEGEAIGVWATNRGADDSSPGVIFSVDGFAKNFSDWGDGGSNIGLSSAEKGVQDAINCFSD